MSRQRFPGKFRAGVYAHLAASSSSPRLLPIPFSSHVSASLSSARPYFFNLFNPFAMKVRIDRAHMRDDDDEFAALV